MSLRGTASKKGGAAAAVVLARGSRTITAAGTYKLTVRLTRKGLRALRGARRMRGKLTVRFAGAGGQTVNHTRRVTLKRR